MKPLGVPHQAVRAASAAVRERCGGERGALGEPIGEPLRQARRALGFEPEEGAEGPASPELPEGDEDTVAEVVPLRAVLGQFDDVEEAAGRLAEILTEVDADVLTIYDDHGGYGHPDHIQIHRVGLRAAELAGTPHVYEATTNRDAMRKMFEQMPRRPSTSPFGAPVLPEENCT